MIRHDDARPMASKCARCRAPVHWAEVAATPNRSTPRADERDAEERRTMLVDLVGVEFGFLDVRAHDCTVQF